MIASPFHSERSEGICCATSNAISGHGFSRAAANAFPLCHLERSRSACDRRSRKIPVQPVVTMLIQGISAMIASPFDSERSEGICLPKANAFPFCHLERSRSACERRSRKIPVQPVVTMLIQGISAMIASPFHSERSEGICPPKANAFPLYHLERSRSACDDGVERSRCSQLQRCCFREFLR
jgi:hypothetical protein